jgi:hypothetical protein
MLEQDVAQPGVHRDHAHAGVGLGDVARELEARGGACPLSPAVHGCSPRSQRRRRSRPPSATRACAPPPPPSTSRGWPAAAPRSGCCSASASATIPSPASRDSFVQRNDVPSARLSSGGTTTYGAASPSPVSPIDQEGDDDRRACWPITRSPLRVAIHARYRSFVGSPSHRTSRSLRDRHNGVRSTHGKGGRPEGRSSRNDPAGQAQPAAPTDLRDELTVSPAAAAAHPTIDTTGVPEPAISTQSQRERRPNRTPDARPVHGGVNCGRMHLLTRCKTHAGRRAPPPGRKLTEFAGTVAVAIPPSIHRRLRERRTCPRKTPRGPL